MRLGVMSSVHEAFAQVTYMQANATEHCREEDIKVQFETLSRHTPTPLSCSLTIPLQFYYQPFTFKVREDSFCTSSCCFSQVLPDRPNLMELRNMEWSGNVKKPTRTFYLSFSTSEDRDAFMAVCNHNLSIIRTSDEGSSSLSF